VKKARSSEEGPQPSGGVGGSTPAAGRPGDATVMAELFKA
jgi:hypothetical protein